MTTHAARIIVTAVVVVASAFSAATQPQGTSQASRSQVREGERLWYPLEGDDNALFAHLTPRGAFKKALNPYAASLFSVTPAKLPFRESWLQKTIAKEFPKVTGVHVVEYATMRHVEDRHTNELRRGLEVFGPTETLKGVRAWLDQIRSLCSTQVKIEFHVVQGDPREESDIRRPEVKVLSAEEFAGQLEIVRASPDRTIIAEPTVIAQNGRPTIVWIGSQTKYVKDCTFPRINNGDRIAVPEIGVIQDGVRTRVTALVFPGRERIALEARVSFVARQRPMRKSIMTPDGLWSPKPGEDQEPPEVSQVIYLPELTCLSWNSRGLEVAPDTYFVVKGLSAPQNNAIHVSIPVRIYAHVTVLPSSESRQTVTGKIVGIDQPQRRVFVRWPEDEERKPNPASVLGVLRAGRRIAQVRVVEHVGLVSICELPESGAEVRVGDLVR